MLSILLITSLTVSIVFAIRAAYCASKVVRLLEETEKH